MRFLSQFFFVSQRVFSGVKIPKSKASKKGRLASPVVLGSKHPTLTSKLKFGSYKTRPWMGSNSAQNFSAIASSGNLPKKRRARSRKKKNRPLSRFTRRRNQFYSKSRRFYRRLNRTFARFFRAYSLRRSKLRAPFRLRFHPDLQRFLNIRVAGRWYGAPASFFFGFSRVTRPLADSFGFLRAKARRGKFYRNSFFQLRRRFTRYFSLFRMRTTRYGRLLLRRLAKKRRPIFKKRFLSFRSSKYQLTRGRVVLTWGRSFAKPRLPRSVYSQVQSRFTSKFRRQRLFRRIRAGQRLRKRIRRRARNTSRYAVLGRYRRHRGYLRFIRRVKHKRHLFIYPPLGMFRRSVHLNRNRYGSILSFFVRPIRFRNRRRYSKRFGRRSQITPLRKLKNRARSLYQTLPQLFSSRLLNFIYIRRTTNNVFYSIFSRKNKLLATFSNGRTEFKGSKRMSTVATEVAVKTIISYLSLNRTKAVFFVFSGRFNHFTRTAVKVFRSRKLAVVGFKYRMRKPHSIGLRLRASRRV